MPAPHSLLAACKIATLLASVPWTRAQPIYRALQQSTSGAPPLLPLSRGRAVCLAEPRYMARFLMGIALTDDAGQVANLVRQYAEFRAIQSSEEARRNAGADFSEAKTLEDAIANSLVEGWVGWTGNEEDAPSTGLASVEFEPDDHPPSARVTYWGGFYRVTRYVEDPFNIPTDIVMKPLVRKTILSGILLHQISREVVWSETGA